VGPAAGIDRRGKGNASKSLPALMTGRKEKKKKTKRGGGGGGKKLPSVISRCWQQTAGFGSWRTVTAENFSGQCSPAPRAKTGTIREEKFGNRARGGILGFSVPTQGNATGTIFFGHGITKTKGRRPQSGAPKDADVVLKGPGGPGSNHDPRFEGAKKQPGAAHDKVSCRVGAAAKSTFGLAPVTIVAGRRAERQRPPSKAWRLWIWGKNEAESSVGPNGPWLPTPTTLLRQERGKGNSGGQFTVHFPGTRFPLPWRIFREAAIEKPERILAINCPATNSSIVCLVGPK